MPASKPHTDHANPSYTSDHHEESKSRTVMSEEKPSTQGAQFRADMHSGTKTELSTEDLEPSADMEFPDGGRGWLVAFGEFCMICATFGLVNSWVS
ncbi:hypothetical protein FRC03_008913 [Tulasnella sp. 419]|nr:hypothetical protein FRC03_008913 [Tulasnella sp. 419]